MKIVVIGAGIAGLAAASKLSQDGHEVILLEANNYIGGRLKTEQLKFQNGAKFAFDHGASWIHGSCAEHPITKLSKKVKAKLVRTDDDSMVVFDSKGNEIDNESQKAWQRYEKLMEKVEDFGDKQADTSVYNVLQSQGGDVNNPIFMFHVANDIEFQTSGDIKNLSAARGLDDDEFEGDEMLILNGYQNFAEYLAKTNKFQLRLNHKVVSVEFDGEVSVVTCGNVGQKFDAESVVIAVPIGILKANKIRFDPPLPGWKEQSLSRIGFGNVCKVAIEFLKDPGLNHQEHYIGVISDNVNERGLFTYFMNLQSLAGLPCLMTFGLGSNADQAQQMSEGEMKQRIIQRLQKFCGAALGPNDIKLTKTMWRSDPSFGGTYSYPLVNSKEEDWEDICRPIFANNWYFCGEHTTQKFRGTVHGAYISGMKAAEAITKGATEDDWVYFDNEEEGEKKESESSSQSDSKSEKSKDDE